MKHRTLTVVRLGVFLLAGRFPAQSDGAALLRSSDAVVEAEAAGFDDAWIAEHHFMSYGVCPSAITFAAHALGRTHRIGLGTAVSVLSTAHPVALAEQVALLDHVSGGRFHLGVGRGGPWVDLEVFGTGLDRYEHGFAEGLDLLMACLSEERVGASGEHFAFREVPMVPRPCSRPPVTVACTSPSTVEVAALRGLPMLLGMHIGDEEKAEMVAQYTKTAVKAGHDPDAVRHVSAVLAYVADDREQAVREVRAATPGWLAEGLGGFMPIGGTVSDNGEAAHKGRPGAGVPQDTAGRPRASRDPDAYTDLLCSLHPVGSPDECVERLRVSAQRTGIRHMIMMVEAGGTRERTLANIARLGAEVLPSLRD